ncbi:MAG: sulfite exporter TauE/SafE family protein, partial [Chitinophagaceae bacterium]|nr:sulfite exporter TauE/SafE family protein [Chitinophagaceae bacterium]
VPVLLLAFPDLEPEVVVSISLSITFLNAFSGTLAYASLRRIDYKSAIEFSLATMPGAIIGALLINHIPQKTFEHIVGFVLVLIAIFLVTRKGLKKPNTNSIAKLTHRDFSDKNGERYVYSFNIRIGMISSFFVGFLSSLLGIGGGIIHVPVMTTVLNFPVHVATATSHFILAVMALIATIIHIFQGNLNGQWMTVLYLGIGVVSGAQIGAKVSHHAKPQWIIYSLATALTIVGLRIMLG